MCGLSLPVLLCSKFNQIAGNICFLVWHLKYGNTPHCQIGSSWEYSLGPVYKVSKFNKFIEIDQVQNKKITVVAQRHFNPLLEASNCTVTLLIEYSPVISALPQHLPFGHGQWSGNVPWLAPWLLHCSGSVVWCNRISKMESSVKSVVSCP